MEQPTLPFTWRCYDYTHPNHQTHADDGRPLCAYYGCNKRGYIPHFTSKRSPSKRRWCIAHFRFMRHLRSQLEDSKQRGDLRSLVEYRMTECIISKVPDIRHVHRLGLEIRSLRHSDPIFFPKNYDIIRSRQCCAYGCQIILCDSDGKCRRYCDRHQNIRNLFESMYGKVSTHEAAINLLLEDVAFHKTTSNYAMMTVISGMAGVNPMNIRVVVAPTA